MAYRISYQSTHKKHVSINCYIRLPLLILVCFFLFLLLVEALWPDGAAIIQKSALYPNGAIAVSALNDLADELHYGEALVTAFADFCREILS